MKKGFHRMPNGKMMSDEEMERRHEKAEMVAKRGVKKAGKKSKKY